ncbi:DUF1217 domain-containing protein [Pseudotabrizicola algicola]|uniref:DUF1217 domain-containing protein n=1 Tax=Pseudotabrizicola algicola TaxID=2709381 RepID=A0A6B3RQV0_9RHOB|nr:DUF1217 domain-containing protein [Pseudotabrizicola algicola]NEX46375.1 DUF1217 domain-containing protein [Pseudotabrizicola algicola]
MSFTPVLPIGGYAGWAFLKRTMAQQTATFNAQPSVRRDEAYFREKIGSITTAEQLVNDPRLLRVALGAFGLEADIGNKFFIRKILEGGTLKTDSLANKLANKQYQKFSNAFGFGNFATPSTKLSDFADKILGSYKKQQFAVAVGTQNEDMRLALNLERELPELAKTSASSLSKWYTIMGNPPLRTVFERAFGLPASFGAINIDKQAETLQARSKALLGSGDVNQFIDPAKVDKLIRQFLVRSEISESASSLQTGQIALTLLQQAPRAFRRP